MGAFDKLLKWHRKHYRFEVGNGGSVQPGDGDYCILQGGTRKIEVYDYGAYNEKNEVLEYAATLDEEGNCTDDGNDHLWTMEQIIEKALELWHSDQKDKQYYYIMMQSGPKENYEAPSFALKHSTLLVSGNLWYQGSAIFTSESEILNALFNHYKYDCNSVHVREIKCVG